MEQEQQTIESLSDLELIAARLETQVHLQNAQEKLKAIEQESIRRVNNLYKSLKAKENKEPGKGTNTIPPEELQNVLKAIRDKKETTQGNADTTGLE